MRRLTAQEQLLILAILAILVVGACVKHFRRRIVPEVIPEFPETTVFLESESEENAED